MGKGGGGRARTRQTPAFSTLLPNRYIFYTANLTFITFSLLTNKPEPHGAKQLDGALLLVLFLYF